ncbi:alpha/beta fold hydrolase [Paenibacillus flagellatus]|uniref:Alpha/beta hydrolase n=1 Tax=Paenibacillus flagellatus TaxID=2211139 RepID=A0A2V5KKK0_9BACL|nr:alpha/beta hydrolase [Paenibacillus flagellatus]PYI51107.1 alpha/beta hydrolase [Paenibacillus flagellatus]
MNKLKLPERAMEVAYRDEGEGMPVLLLHGFCGSSSYWDAIIPLLAGHCRLIVPDLPGHGSTGVPAQPYPIESFADDMAALLRRLNVEKAIWIGHSLGGYVTLAAAERHPDVVAAFGLVHSTAFPDDEQGRENRLKAIQTVLDSGIVPFVDGLIPKLFAPKHVESMEDRVEEAKKIGYGTPAEGAVLTLEAMRGRPDRNGVLAGFERPVLLVAGESDQVIKTEKTFSAQGTNIRQTLLADCGHMSMMEAPARLAETLQSFVESVRPSVGG